ncbi:RHS repeat-associated core domain-containing protein [uncultured Stenotrophomonas sp.]|uniref:RHS repeat-associated core domain-containing protein n=1 Tax=uncultured Stenotrophomonas sp. TaxID=165438 RepID=UPI0028F11702|nr:RHS repeat-associated core domain-containing protein [uncultured Stenotrophomonas sp.]
MTLLLATGMLHIASAQETVEYIHTDALGSPVAMTDAGANVIERIVYEPYGAVVNGAPKDGPGYAGHVADSSTGLSYMQQRYMDPQSGTFLSVDPVSAHGGSVASFNRYRYGNSSPYRFSDPDGRNAVAIETIAVPLLVVATLYYAAPPEQKAAIERAIDSGVDKLVQRAKSLGGDGGDDAGDQAKGDRGNQGTAGGERAYKPFTKAGKEKVRSENASKNGGQTTCTDCEIPTVPAVKSQAGVTPPKNETAVDHVIPRSKGGDGSPSNGQVLCRECNGRKSDKL